MSPVVLVVRLLLGAPAEKISPPPVSAAMAVMAIMMMMVMVPVHAMVSAIVMAVVLSCQVGTLDVDVDDCGKRYSC